MFLQQPDPTPLPAGVYALARQERGGVLSAGTPRRTSPADEQQCQVLHMAIYIHFEQLLGPAPHTMRGYAVPQASYWGPWRRSWSQFGLSCCSRFVLLDGPLLLPKGDPGSEVTPPPPPPGLPSSGCSLCR